MQVNNPVYKTTTSIKKLQTSKPKHTNNTTRINVNNYVYICRDFEKAKSLTFGLKNIHQAADSAILKVKQSTR